MRMTAWVGALPRDARDTLFLLGVIGIVLLPQVPELPWWCILLTTIVLVWRGTLAVAAYAQPIARAPSPPTARCWAARPV